MYLVLWLETQDHGEQFSDSSDKYVHVQIDVVTVSWSEKESACRHTRRVNHVQRTFRELQLDPWHVSW